LFTNDNARLNISTGNTIRDPPNHLAASLGHINIVSWMIERGVAIDRRNGLGSAALDKAIEKGNQESISELQSGVEDISV
jgi:ankyrin repeat protein